MWRLRLVRDTASSAAMDGPARAEAIAAMAHRLAAAGPRTRQSLAAQDMPRLVATRAESLAMSAARPPLGNADRAALRRNVVLGGFLGLSACGGFGLMLMTQSLIHHPARTAPELLAPGPISAPQAAASPPEAAIETLISQASVAAESFRTPPVWKLPAVAATYRKGVVPIRHAAPAMLATSRQPAALPPLRAVPALYRLPRWLTEPHPPIVMSPPPHDLQLPP